MTQNDLKFALQPYVPDGAPAKLYEQLEQYLQLLVKWNARTNLTAIREPEEIVRRHFGESLFAAQHLGEFETLLDFGSGAGFPGLPIQLLHPDLRVTLAESQNKKSTFLREVVRSFDLKTEIWPGRVEAMPAAMRFDVVTLRAVDNMEAAVIAASSRTAKRLMVLTTATEILPSLEAFSAPVAIPMPGSSRQQLLSFDRAAESTL